MHGAGGRGPATPLAIEQRAERGVGDADAARERTDERGHDRERVDEQRRGQAEVDPEPGEHHEQAGAAEQLAERPRCRAARSRRASRHAGDAIAQASSWPAHPSTSRMRTPEPVAAAERSAATGPRWRRPRATADSAIEHERRHRRRPRTRRSRSRRTSAARAGRRSRRRRPRATPIRQQSEMRLGQLGREVGGGRAGSALPDAVGVGEVGHEAGGARPTSPPCWWRTTSRSSFTIGANRAVELDEPERRARLQAPVQHAEARPSASPIGQRGGTERRPPCRARGGSRRRGRRRTTPTNRTRTAPRIRGVQPVRRFTAGASSGVPENLMWTVSSMAGVTPGIEVPDSR